MCRSRSLGESHHAQFSAPIMKVTMETLAEMKLRGKPIAALTAYDDSSARLEDKAGIELILVGDFLTMEALGHQNALAVTIDEMLLRTRAVGRAVRRGLVVADLPFGSYHVPVTEGASECNPLHS